MTFSAVLSGIIIRRISNYIYVSVPFHLERVNKLYRKLNQWNSETTQNLNIYLHNYQTETAIFLATKHEKIVIARSYLSFPSHTEIHQKSNKMVAFARNYLVKGCFSQFLLYIIVRLF